MSGKTSSWRVALVLGVAMGIACVLVIPYALAALGGKAGAPGIPVPLAYAISGAQGAVAGFLFAWAGLAMGSSIGLDAPFLRAWVGRTDVARPRRRATWVVAVVTGAVAGLVIVGLDAAFFAKLVASVTPGTGHATRWQGMLASFYGGIGEEVQVRLFLMTAIAWCLAKLARVGQRRDGARATPATPPAWVFVTAIVVAALAFGAGHLPAAAKVFGSLSAVVVVRTVLLNSLAGLAFGALYWRRGLEHAMVAHFTADLVLHVVAGG